MEVFHTKPVMALPPLYSTVKLARIVQRVKDRLKSCIKRCLLSRKTAQYARPTHVDTNARKTVIRWVIVLDPPLLLC